MHKLLIALILFVSPVFALSESDVFFQEGTPSFVSTLKSEDQTVEFPKFEILAKELGPSVVNISVDANGKKEKDSENEDQEPEEEFPFFNERPNRALGTGIILSENGYIVTNNHVVQSADKIIVKLLDDRKKYEAELIGVDDKTDLALIKIKSDSSLKPVYLGDSDKIEVGEWVMAIGNQFQLGQTVTAGIVSAKSRKVYAAGPYDNFIQTDASINPGSSGGPLFNTKGQVIGINTAIFSPGRSQFGGQGFNIGIGFAIPINLAKGIIKQLRQSGKVVRGLLGVIIQNIDADLAQALGSNSIQGALVADIIDGTPAAKAGFKVKDVIISYDGKPIKEHDELPILVANTSIGGTVPVEVLRSGKSVLLYPTITELDTKTAKLKEKNKPTQKADKFGLIVQDLTSELADSLGYELDNGALVAKVEKLSPAAETGIARGDLIVEVDNKKIRSKAEYDQIIKNIPKDTPVLFLVEKKEGARFLTLKAKD